MCEKENLAGNQQNILTVQEVAEALRVSRSTVWRWCRDGTLTTAFKIGRNWRIRHDEVTEIVDLQNYKMFKMHFIK